VTEQAVETGDTMIGWFDDPKLRIRFKSGETIVSREEIVRFASGFDPQPIAGVIA
jgi:hypothetical protein